MVQQHAYYGQNFNGEGTMKLLYGEYPGQDFNFPYMAPGWSPLMNNQSTITQSSSSIYDSYPWYYYYLIIGNANAVINRIDKAERFARGERLLESRGAYIPCLFFLPFG